MRSAVAVGVVLCSACASAPPSQPALVPLEVLRDEEVEDVPDWAKDRAKLVRFVARKK